MTYVRTYDVDDPGPDEIRLVADDDDGLLRHGVAPPKILQNLLRLAQGISVDHAVHNHHGVRYVR